MSEAGFGFWHRLGLATGTRDDSGPVGFVGLARRTSPNDCLIAPPDFECRADRDTEPSVFRLPAQALAEKLRAIALAEPRTQQISCGIADRLRFVQRSQLLNYPDVIDVQILSRGEDTSTLALYSRSLVGRSDLGVNRQRLDRWLKALAV